MDTAVFSARIDNFEYIKFCGTVRYSNCAALENYIEKLFENVDFDGVVIDLKEADILDSTALGMLAKIANEQGNYLNNKPVILVRQGELANILKRVCFDQVFNIFEESLLSSEAQLNRMPTESATEDEEAVLNRVIEAHKHLAILDKKNESLYRDLSQAIE